MTTQPSDDIDLVSTAERTITDLAGRGMAPLMALGRYKYLRAHEPLAVQRHRTLLVVAQPIKGRFTFAVGDATVDVRPGEAVRIPPGTGYRTGLAAEPRGELMWLILRHQPGRQGEADLRRVIALLSRPGGPLTWPADVDPRATADRLFAQAARPRDWIADGLLRHGLIETLLRLARGLHQSPATAPAHGHRGVARALAWLDAHLAGPCDVTDLEAASGLSSSRFYEVFREQTGTTPKDYLLRRRIEYAHGLLRAQPGRTVTEVAHALGFSSSHHFATVFRRYLGCTPTEARRST